MMAAARQSHHVLSLSMSRPKTPPSPPALSAVAASVRSSKAALPQSESEPRSKVPFFKVDPSPTATDPLPLLPRYPALLFSAVITPRFIDRVYTSATASPARFASSCRNAARACQR